MDHQALAFRPSRPVGQIEEPAPVAPPPMRCYPGVARGLHYRDDTTRGRQRSYHGNRRTRDRSASPARESRHYERERSNSADRYRSRRDRSRENGDYERRGSFDRHRSHEDRAATKEAMMSNIRESSQQDRRVYVGNLSYDVKWHHLKDFMKPAGEVLFADVLLLPNGMSKGCGIVEYASREQAQTAINTLSNQNLMGRLVYVREDRETEPRFNSGPPGGGRGGFEGGYGGGRGGYQGGGGGNFNAAAQQGPARQIFVSNLPFTVGWQDLKDLFRQAVMTGAVLRADVHTTHDGRPKGSGIVAFDNPDDAQNAIAQFNGYDWQGRILEVRPDRFAGAPAGGRGGFGGGFRGGFAGGPGGPGFGGRGGYGGGFGGGRGGYGGGYGGRGGFGGAGYGGAGGFGGGGAPPAPAAAPNPFTDFATSGTEPSATIYVRNLPWSTSNDDLVELFQTIAKVDRAEIAYEPNGRSRGTGVVQFSNQEDAATAISKFQGYEYGGRPLGLSYVRYNTSGGDAMEGQESTGAIQAEMM